MTRSDPNVSGELMIYSGKDGRLRVQARLKLFYLALKNISRKWTLPIRDWKAALTRFTYPVRRPDEQPLT